MVLDQVTVLRRDLVLQRLDLLAVELDHLAGIDIDHVVVVLAAVQLVDRMTAFEVVLEHQARGFELGQHAVDRGQTDFLAIAQQLLVDVFGGHVARLGLLQQLQDAHPRMRDLQANLA